MQTDLALQRVGWEMGSGRSVVRRKESTVPPRPNDDVGGTHPRSEPVSLSPANHRRTIPKGQTVGCWCRAVQHTGRPLYVGCEQRGLSVGQALAAGVVPLAPPVRWSIRSPR